MLGIDPAPEQAEAAEAAGVPTLQEFFGADLARRLVAEGKRADVIIANNVMAHAPELNGFVEGIAILLADDGVATIENPYVKDLIDHAEFDTIYHEHFCYFSCTAVDALMRRHGLVLNHVEHFPTCTAARCAGGSAAATDIEESARSYLEAERADGLTDFAYYETFGARVEAIRTDLLELLARSQARRQAHRRLRRGGQGQHARQLRRASAATSSTSSSTATCTSRGCTCRAPTSRSSTPRPLLEERPDYVLLLAWNFRDEVIAQQAEYLAGGGRFIVPVPTPQIV